MSKKAKSGSAMGLVLVFMVMMIILGTGALAMAHYGAVHSAGASQADTHYYAAESAAQLAAQMFSKELNEIAEELNDEDHSGSSIDELQDEIKDKLESSINTTIKDTLQSMIFGTFKEETVSLKIDIDDINVEEEINGDAEGGAKYKYNCVFVIRATSGGRTVSADIVNELTLTATAKTKLPQSLSGGAYYEDEYDDENYSGNSPEIYGAFCDALENLFDNARNLKVIPDNISGWYTFTGTTLTNAAAGSQKYIKRTGDLTLKLDNSSSSSLALEYLDVTGNLTISGTNYVPDLKGVRVGGTITVSSGAKIYGRENGAPYGTNFLSNASDASDVSKGKITVRLGSTTIINWCRFYAQGADIEFPDSGDAISTNSVFVATKGSYGGGNLSITAKKYRVDTTGDVPQFYAENKLSVLLQNSQTSIIGILGTSGTDDVFNIQGSASGCTIKAVVIGNCYSIKTGYTLQKIQSGQTETLMDGGVFTYIDVDGSGNVTPGGAASSITYQSKFSGLNIREITGEQP